MNLDKSKKRIDKKAKKGFQGYPQITLRYYGPDKQLATKVTVSYIAEEGGDEQMEVFTSKTDIRENEVVQSTIIKIIDRSEAKTVNTSEEIVACPHDEGVDYAIGGRCPTCTFWK